MRYGSLALTGSALLFAASASAQIHTGQAAMDRLGTDPAPAHTEMPAYEQKECLRNLKTKKRECRKRAEWRKVAAKLAAQEAAPAPRPH